MAESGAAPEGGANARQRDGEGSDAGPAGACLTAAEVFAEELSVHLPDVGVPLAQRIRESRRPYRPPERVPAWRLDRRFELWLWPDRPEGSRRSAQQVALDCRQFNDAVHAAARRGGRRSALCLSGGGIRSATFNLGVLQALGRRKLLQSFHYLSTVSGGGYIGSWLGAWAYNHPEGIAGVERDLEAGRNPDAVSGLRSFSRFLSPRFGAFSADFWTLVVTYLRNLFLHWMVFIPLLLAVLLLPRLVLAITESADSLLNSVGEGSWAKGIPQQATLLFGGASAAWAFAYAALSQPSTYVQLRDAGRNHRPSSEAGATRRFLVFCLMPLCVSGGLLSIYARLRWLGPPSQPVMWSASASVALLAIPLAWGLAKAAANSAPAGVFAASVATSVVAGLAIGWTQLLPEGLHSIVFGAVVGAFGAVLATIYAPGANQWRRPLLAALAGAFAGVLLGLGQHVLAPDFLAEHLAVDQSMAKTLSVVFSFPAALSSLAAGGALYIGLTSRHDDVWDGDREWWARFGAWLTLVTIAWPLCVGVVLIGPLLLVHAGSWFKAISLASLGGASGIMTLVLGSSADTRATPAAGANGGRAARLKGLLLKLAAPLFLVLVLAGLSLACAWLIWLCPVLRPTLSIAERDEFGMTALKAVTVGTSWVVLLSLAVGLTLLSVVAAMGIDLNRFSMHALYRERLVRAFLGVSNADRDPDAFTNFDGRDNIALRKLAPGMFRTRDLKREPRSAGLRRERSLIVALRPYVLGKRSDGSDAALLAGRLSPRVREGIARSMPAPGWVRRALVDDINDLISSFNLTTSRGLTIVPRPERERRERARRLSTQAIRRNADEVERMFPDAFTPSRRQRAVEKRPLHVVNVALNLVSSRRPTLQDRKAASFTFSPLHCGSWELGYRDTQRYGGSRGVSLGSAMTISGAAVSPNQGYHSSPFITFLLAFFNIRLGLWLGNPGPGGERSWRQHAPQLGFGPPILEAFGMTDDEHDWVYLSDGGHFDNLGLYEMVRRRVHDLVVVDAGADPNAHFTDLANAIRKIEIDMGIPIVPESQPIPIRARDGSGGPGQYARVLRIDYGAVDGPTAQSGRIIYLKSCLYGQEPTDVLEYATTSPTFPHESTTNQFYSEAQMESYRRLGRHEVDALTGPPRPMTLDELFATVRATLGVVSGPPGTEPEAA